MAGQFDRLREIQEQAQERQQEEQQAGADVRSALEDLEASSILIAEETTAMRSSVDRMSGKVTHLVNGQTDLLEVLLESQTSIDSMSGNITHLVDAQKGATSALQESQSTLDGIHRAVETVLTPSAEESPAADAIEDRFQWERDQARSQEFMDQHWRDRELGLLEEISGKLATRDTGTGVQATPDQQESDDGGGFGLGALGAGGIGKLLGSAKGLASLGLKLGGPLALLAGAWSFMEGFSNAEEALGRPAEHIGDQLAAGAATVVSDFTNAVGGIANMFLPENMQIPELSPREVIDKAKEAWDNLTSFFTEQSVPEMFDSISEGLGQLFRVGGEMFSDVLGGAAGLFFGDEVGRIVGDLSSDVLTGLGDMFGSLSDLSSQIMNNLIGDGSADIEIWEAAKGVWDGLLDAAVGLVTGVGDLIWKAFEFFDIDEEAAALWEGITGIADSVVQGARDTADSVLGFVGGLFGRDDLDMDDVKDVGREFASNIATGAKTLGGWAMDLFDSAADSNWEPDSIKETARDIAQGIRDKVGGWGDSIAGFFGFGDDDDEVQEEVEDQKRRQREEIQRTMERERETFGPGQGARLQREREEDERREREERQQMQRPGPTNEMEQTRAQIISQINNRTTVQEVKSTRNPGRRQPSTDRVM